MAVDIDAALKHMYSAGGSDLHIKVPAPPTMRLNGVLSPIPGTDKVMPDDSIEALRHITRDVPEKFEEFEQNGEVDFAYPLPGVARFRVNAFTQRGSCSIVMRAIGIDIKSVEELMLPPAVKELAREERGVVLVTGTTGSGKSTTLAAMVKEINEHQPKHIITLEDPIEFLHRDAKALIQQREIGADTDNFATALRRILRQDPDVILIGEMRDEETVQTALSSAETGHLVFSTLHTLNVTETINRVIDFFPLHQNKQVRAMLAGTLRGIVSQRLVPTVDGKGRVPIVEVMIATSRIRDMIVDPEQTSKIEEAIAEGGYYGMQTFDQALLAHLRAGRITIDEALKAATSPNDFKLMVAAEGLDKKQDAEGDGRRGGAGGSKPTAAAPRAQAPTHHPPQQSASAAQQPPTPPQAAPQPVAAAPSEPRLQPPSSTMPGGQPVQPQ